MTPQDWTKCNRPFFHITATNNVPSILTSGLEKRNSLGICVCNCDDPKVIEYVTEMMLVEEGVWDYSVIRIFPKEHNLTENDLAGDQVVEGTNALHSYILRKSLPIKKEDIVSSYKRLRLGLVDEGRAIREIDAMGLLEQFSIDHQRIAHNL